MELLLLLLLLRALGAWDYLKEAVDVPISVQNWTHPKTEDKRSFIYFLRALMLIFIE